MAITCAVLHGQTDDMFVGIRAVRCVEDDASQADSTWLSAEGNTHHAQSTPGPGGHTALHPLTAQQQQLKRLLGRGFSIAVCIGTIIGLGILRTPGEIAGVVQDPWLYMALWAGGGMFVLLSTLVASELIALTPRSGGPYVLVAGAFGPYPGFLLGWTDWAANCAAASLKAVVFMEFLALLLPWMRPWTVPGALLLNGAFALLQLAGVRISGAVLQVAAAAFGIILFAFSVALLFGSASAPSAAFEIPAHLGEGWTPFGIVAASIVFTYDGWVSASYYSGEVNGGARASALGSIRGVLIVIVLYLLLNGLLVASVPMAALRGQELALAGALDYLFGGGAGLYVTLAALFILMFHQNVQYMAASRVLYALSVDGLGTKRATSVSDLGTPTGAVLASWALMSALILAGGFAFLLNLSALLFIAGYVALMLGVWRMRRLAPERERPVRAWGYPASMVLCAAGWISVGLFVGLMDLQSAAWTIVLAAVSAPVFLLLRHRRRLRSAAA